MSVDETIDACGLLLDLTGRQAGVLRMAIWCSTTGAPPFKVNAERAHGARRLVRLGYLESVTDDGRTITVSVAQRHWNKLVNDANAVLAASRAERASRPIMQAQAASR